jgi:hypothetical protein
VVDKTTPKLYYAAKANRLEELRHLLRAGHDPNSPTEATPMGPFPISPGKRNPLHIAVIYGHIDIVSELLEAGINTRTPDKHGWTALHFVGLNGRPHSTEVAQLLLSAGADTRATVAVSLNPSRDNAEILHETAEALARRHGQYAVADVIAAHVVKVGAGGGRARRAVTVAQLHVMDPKALEREMLDAQLAEPMDEDWLREVVTAINALALRGMHSPTAPTADTWVGAPSMESGLALQPGPGPGPGPGPKRTGGLDES